MPESRQMIIEYMAISPSMNDQWSGKTFLSRNAAPLAAPVRSSTQLAMPPTCFMPAPGAEPLSVSFSRSDAALLGLAVVVINAPSS